MMLHPRSQGFGQAQALDPSLIPGSVVSNDISGNVTVTSTPVDLTAQNAMQDFVNSLSPAAWAALQGSSPPATAPPATSSNMSTYLIIALIGFGVVLVVKKR